MQPTNKYAIDPFFIFFKVDTCASFSVSLPKLSSKSKGIRGQPFLPFGIIRALRNRDKLHDRFLMSLHPDDCDQRHIRVREETGKKGLKKVKGNTCDMLPLWLGQRGGRDALSRKRVEF